MLRNTKDIENYTIHATEGEMGHQVLIAPQWIKHVSWPDKCVSVDLTRASVKDVPPYDSTAELNRERESGLYQHCGSPGYWTDAPVIPESRQ